MFARDIVHSDTIGRRYSVLSSYMVRGYADTRLAGCKDIPAGHCISELVRTLLTHDVA